MGSPNTSKLARWMGGWDKLDNISRNMAGWYGPPIFLYGVPTRNGIWMGRDGDLYGDIDGGGEASWLDHFVQWMKTAVRKQRNCPGMVFDGLSSLITAATDGHSMTQTYWIDSSIPTTATGAFVSLAPFKELFSNGSALPGGTVHNNSSGRMVYIETRPSNTDTRLVSGFAWSSVSDCYQMVYDRLWSGQKNVGTTSPETVTGVPSRYTTAPPSDYPASGNFLFMEATGTVANTAHNWDGTYLDQGGNAGTLPTLAGIQSAHAGRVDHQSWFYPLASGDSGISALTEITQSATLGGSTAINAVIGHPIGIIATVVNQCVQAGNFFTGSASRLPRVHRQAHLCVMLIGLPGSSPPLIWGQLNFVWGAT